MIAFDPARLRELRYAIVSWSAAILNVFAPDATRAYVLFALASRLRRVAAMKAARLGPVEAAATLAEAHRRGLLTRRLVDQDVGDQVGDVAGG